MLILVAVSVRVVKNSDLIGVAKQAGKLTEEAQEKEKSGKVKIGGVEYNSLEEYKQTLCSHEWGEWEITKQATCSEIGTQKRTCLQCGKIEEAEVEKIPHIIANGKCTECGETHTLQIGAYIEGYNPGIAEEGKTIVTSYTSEGAQSNGDNPDGTSGNGYGNQTFSFTAEEWKTTEEEKAENKTKWIILGEENGQIMITPASSVTTEDSKQYYLSGMAGYVNGIEELNKISAIYGQGKYADTNHFSYTIEGTELKSGARSIKIEDAGFTEVKKSYITVSTDENRYIINTGDSYSGSSSSYQLKYYYGLWDDDEETGAEWIQVIGASQLRLGR